MKYFIGLVLLAMLFAIFVVFPVMAQTTMIDCGSTYTVLSGEHMAQIARLCGVGYRDLIIANPQIPDPDVIYPGEVLNIPNGSTTPTTNINTVIIPVTGNSSVPAPAAVAAPSMSVMPAVGVIGSTVTIAASGFQANQPVEIRFGMPGGAYYQMATAVTDGNGALYGQYQVPNWPNVDNVDGQYTFIVDLLNQPAIRAESTPFSLTGTGNVPDNPPPVVINSPYYMVQNGDTLAGIAAKFYTTTDLLIALNPAIGNTGAVFPGQVINLPVP